MINALNPMGRKDRSPAVPDGTGLSDFVLSGNSKRRRVQTPIPTEGTVTGKKQFSMAESQEPEAEEEGRKHPEGNEN